MLQRWCNLFELQIIVDKANMAAAWLCQTGKTKRPRKLTDEKATTRVRPRQHDATWSVWVAPWCSHRFVLITISFGNLNANDTFNYKTG